MLNRLANKVFLFGLLLLAVSGGVFALEPMEEDQMAEINGEGMALGLANFRLMAGGTSYFEATGQYPSVAVGQLKRGDGRYYGISISGTTPVATWAGPCGAGIANMGCPIGNAIPYFAAFDNPFILRVFDYSAQPSGVVTRNYNGIATTQTAFELLAPTNQDPWRFGTWIEIRVANNLNVTQGLLQQEWIMNNSKLYTVDVPGSTTRVPNKIRIVKHTDPGDLTVGFIWENHFQGDFRLGVNQQFISPDSYGVTPMFSDNEGVYVRNIQTFVPMGQMFYQSLIVDDTAANDGNFRIEVTAPNSGSAAVLSDFYSVSTSDATGYLRCNTSPCTTGTNLRPLRYYETHGFFRMGDWFPTCAQTNCMPAVTGTINAVSSTSDGLFFVAYDPTAVGARFNAFSDRQNTSNMDANPVPRLNNSLNGNYNVINLGDSRIEGLLLQHLEIKTRGI